MARAAAALRDGLTQLASDADDFWIPARVARIDRPISALQFLRDFVQPSVPCILREGCGLLDHWPAVYRWQNWSYLRERVGADTLVTVNATPNGRGDAILDVERSGYPLVVATNEDEEDESSPTAPSTAGSPARNKPSASPSPPPLVFIKPEAWRMPFGDFLDRLGEEREGEKAVLYLSQQDDSLRKEFPMLCRPSSSQGDDEYDHHDDDDSSLDTDIDSGGFPIACEAFGNEPDAVNLWIGDDRAVSTFHRDPLENMYAVLVGEKHFTLLPPCDAWALPEAANLPQAHFRSKDDDNECFEVVLEQGAAPITWIDLELEAPEEEVGKSPSSLGQRQQHRWRPQHAPQRGRWGREGALHPLECTVKAGEVLYLPALWYHRVTQTCPTVAVNFWHDMRFDARFVYWQFVGRAGKALQQLEEDEDDEAEGEGENGTLVRR